MKLTVAYDGTDFYGFASQKGRRTVHCTLKDAVRQISGEDCEIIGASRTDSGAHARAQVVHFDTANPMDVLRWPQVLNKVLPPDLAIVKAERVLSTFHARFSAQDREYRYRIRTGGRDPFLGRVCYETHRPLDTELMHRVAQGLVGRHDFFGYSEEVERDANHERVVLRIQVKRSGDEHWFDVRAQAFMRGMMRRIAGALFEVGTHRRNPDEIVQLLDPALREKLQFPVVLPAKGLCLMKIRYGRHPKDFRTPQNEGDN